MGSFRSVLVAVLLILFAPILPASAEVEVWTLPKTGNTEWHSGCNSGAVVCYETIDWRHDQRPTGIFEKVGECTSNSTCRAILKGLMVYAGMSPQQAQVAVETASIALAAGGGQEGEGVKHTFTVPDPDRRICTVRWKVWSGTGHAAIGFTPFGTRVVISSYARKNNIGGAGEWIKTIFEIRTVRRDKLTELRNQGRCLNSQSYGKGVPIWHDGPIDETGNAISVLE